MKTSGVIFVIFLFLFFVSALSANDQGEKIFKSYGCIFCHKSGTSSGTIPSIPEMAKAYKGKKEQLVKFFKGETSSIIRPERSATMKRQIEKTKALSDAERTALVDFIMSH